MAKRWFSASVLAVLCTAALRPVPLEAQVPVRGYAVDNGDTNGDLDRDLSDGIYLLSHLFSGTTAPVPLAFCPDAPLAVENGDSNGDSLIDLSDAIHIFSYLYSGGPEPVPACSTTEAGAGGHFGFRPRVVPPHARPHGRTYAQWGAAWWRWAYSIPAEINPIFDTTGASCEQGQRGPVWFLAGTAGGPTTRSCSVPAGKEIFFPVINVINDFPCPDPSFQPAPGQSLEDFLTEGAAYLIDRVDELEIELDGALLRAPFRFRATSDLFTFTGDPSMAAVFDPCITGTPQDAVTDGYWIMLAPLSRGEHVLHSRGKIVFDDGSSFESDVTYHLTVGETH